MPQASLNLEYCAACGFIRQVQEIQPSIDYAHVERGTAQQLPHYTTTIIDGMKKRGITTQDFIVEIGCNDGSFLDALKASGFENLLGVEPSVGLSQTAASKGFRVEPIPLTPDNARKIIGKHGQADAVVCRHTLEHVPAPKDLIAAIATLLKPGGICIIEVPDTDWVIEHLCIHEIWDEHISYFRPGSLHRLLKSKGLSVLALDAIRFRDTRNLVCFAMRGETPDALEQVRDQTTLEDIANCADRWRILINSLQNAIAAAPKPLIAIGASHIQINFINFAKLDMQIQILIDDDPRKQNRRAPIGKGIPIISTDDAIESIVQGTILRTAFPYPAWMDKITDTMAAKGVTIIDPFDL
ncbi:MAG: class I SAM-dependent methyltransferase [Parvibaculum sp.]|nr:class I SAM-dependent methyltransferase [Parvibaculum sp.]